MNIDNILKAGTKTTLLALTLCMTGLASCAFREDDIEEERRKNTEQVLEALQGENEKYELNKSNVSHSLDELEVGWYLLNLKFPANIPKIEIKINDENTEGVPQIVSYARGYSVRVRANAELKIYFTVKNEIGNSLSTYVHDVETPEDLIITDTYHVPDYVEEIRFRRMLIKEKGKIVTGRQALIIKTKHLVVEQKMMGSSQGYMYEPHIATNILENSDTDFAATTGRIEIQAERATGRLYINSIGIDGQVGRDGEDAPQEHDKNLDGKDAIYKTTSSPGGMGLLGEGMSPPSCSSKKQTSATAGKKGHSGGNGLNGVDGGDSPLFVVNVQDYSDFSVYILNRPGQGGLGGRGGRGGPGGKGGSDNYLNDQCRWNKTKAADGEVGDSGQEGERGKDGIAHGLQTNIPAGQVSIETYRF